MSDLRTRAEGLTPVAPTTGGVTGEWVDAGVTPAPLGNVDESPVPVGMDVPVYVAWTRVMQDCAWLSKSRQGDKYMYRGIDDVTNLVGPALRRHGVFVMPAGIEPTFTVINTRSGAAMNYARCVVHFTIYGPRGDTMPASVLGEGFDNGDKSGSKAQSVALRTLYLNALAIQTNEPARDTEYGVQHEIAGPKAPTAAEYQAEILNEGTTMQRLYQIRAELKADERMWRTEVESLGGQREALGDLLVRIGKDRAARGEGK